MTRPEKVVKVGPKGQVVIPKAIRERIGINPGDEVLVDAADDRATVRRILSLDELEGIFKDAPGDSLAELEAEHRREIERDEKRIRGAST